MCCSGNVDVFQWNWEWFWSRHVQFDSGFHMMAINEISWDRPNHFWLHHHTMTSLVVELKKTCVTLLKDYLVLLLCLGSPGEKWMFSDPDLLQKFWLSHLRLGMWNFHLSLALTLPLHWAFGRGVQMRPSPPSLQCLRPICLLSRFSCVQYISKEYTWQDFRTKMTQSR